MAQCTNQPIGIGRDLVLSWVEGCGSDSPLTTALTPLEYTKLGFVETRSENNTPRTVTSNTDSSGIYTDTSVIGNDVEISASVLDAKDVINKRSQQALRRYYMGELMAARQPTVWVRITDALLDEYRYYFCNITALNRSAENEGNRTGDFTFTAIPTYNELNPTYQSELITPEPPVPAEQFTWFDANFTWS